MTNRPAYKARLRRRGDLTVWLDEAALAGWLAPRRTTPGGQSRYSNLAIELVLTLRIVFHLALRQAEAFSRSVLALLGLGLTVPDHTTLSRRSRAFTGRQPRVVRHDGPVHLVLDSTGLQLFGQGEWDAHKHGRTRCVLDPPPPACIRLQQKQRRCRTLSQEPIREAVGVAPAVHDPGSRAPGGLSPATAEPALSCRPFCGGLRRFYGSQIESTTLMALKKSAPAAAKPAAKASAAKAATAKPPAAKALAVRSSAPAAKAKVAAPKQATISLKQIAAELADAHELERRDAEALLSGMVETLVAHLHKGDRLRLTGLGILQVRDSPARIGRNPATGDQIQIAAKRKIVFRPATDLKTALTG